MIRRLRLLHLTIRQITHYPSHYKLSPHYKRSKINIVNSPMLKGFDDHRVSPIHDRSGRTPPPGWPMSAGVATPPARTGHLFSNIARRKPLSMGPKPSCRSATRSCRRRQSVGYSDHSSCTRAFRQWANCTPRQWRREQGFGRPLDLALADASGSLRTEVRVISQSRNPAPWSPMKGRATYITVRGRNPLEMPGKHRRSRTAQKKTEAGTVRPTLLNIFYGNPNHRL